MINPSLDEWGSWMFQPISKKPWCPCRLAVVIGGTAMVGGALMGAAPGRPWEDAGWLVAFTGLVSVVIGFLSPHLKSARDIAALRKAVESLTIENRNLAKQLESEIIKNRDTTTRASDASRKENERLSNKSTAEITAKIEGVQRKSGDDIGVAR